MVNKKTVTEAITDICIESHYGDPRYTFTHGRCLEFAEELVSKLGYGRIMYLPLYEHFIVDIDGFLYDVNGNVTTEYSGEEMINKDSIPDYILSFYKH